MSDISQVQAKLSENIIGIVEKNIDETNTRIKNAEDYVTDDEMDIMDNDNFIKFVMSRNCDGMVLSFGKNATLDDLVDGIEREILAINRAVSMLWPEANRKDFIDELRAFINSDICKDAEKQAEKPKRQVN